MNQSLHNKQMEMESLVSDDDLLTAALDGDIEAEGVLFERYSAYLYASMFTMTNGDAHAADDIVQETFLRAHTKLQTFQRRCHIKTWLYRIGCNYYFWHRKRNKVIHTVIDNDRFQLLDLLQDHTSLQPLNALLLAEQCSLVHECMQQIRAEHSSILALRYFSEKTYEEIGEELHIPPGTVRSRISRAKQHLAKAVSEALQEEQVCIDEPSSRGRFIKTTFAELLNRRNIGNLAP